MKAVFVQLHMPLPFKCLLGNNGLKVYRFGARSGWVETHLVCRSVNQSTNTWYTACTTRKPPSVGAHPTSQKQNLRRAWDFAHLWSIAIRRCLALLFVTCSISFYFFCPPAENPVGKAHVIQICIHAILLVRRGWLAALRFCLHRRHHSEVASRPD